MRLWAIALFLIVVTCLLTLLAYAGELQVRLDGTGDFAVIQEAIDATIDGDVVIVHPGTYYENVKFRGANITLRSLDPEDPGIVETTVIDGGGRDGSVVTFTGYEDRTCLLSGLTITGGRGYTGGGIRGGDSLSFHVLARTRATISHCRIINNSANDGAGIAHCDGAITDCLIAGNSSNIPDVGARGGGLYDCLAAIASCQIIGNSAGFGGGLDDCDGPIGLCVISKNQAVTICGGGLAFCDGEVHGCLINDNSARSGGGGLYYCRADVSNCTIYGNETSDEGGALYQCTGAVSNCIIWGNTAELGGDLYESSTPSFSCISGWTGGGRGNTSEDAQFLAAADDNFRLALGSPCIDAGNNWAVEEQTDLDGSPRIINRTVEMGAYEYQDGCWNAVSTDAQMYRGQSTMALTLKAGNFGSTRVVDIYAALQFPNGRLVFIPSPSGAWSAWVSGLSLASGDVFTPTEPFSYPFSGSDLDGGYSVYAALFAHGSTDPADRLTNIAVSSFRYDAQAPTELHVAKDGTGHFGTVQDAIDAAAEGGTVVVHPGVYLESVCLKGKNITIRSTAPENHHVVDSTIIAGGGHVVAFVGSESKSCLLWGLTIADGDGSGIYGASCSASIKNCIVRDNSEGGIVGCDGLIADCTISGNYKEYGGGLCECNGDIIGCNITGNFAGLSGGGLAYCNGRIMDCTISENQTTLDPEWTPFGGGGAVACDGLFKNCLIYGNSTRCYGGGVWASNATFDNCIFWQNQANYSYGGICGYNTPSQCHPKVANCTFVDNHGAMRDCFGPIRNCIFWRNAPGNYSGVDGCPDVEYCCISNWTSGGVGNISDNPAFVRGPFGSRYLSPVSPCIDAGSTSAEMAGLSDRTTQADGTPDAGIVDMGYHYPIPKGSIDVVIRCWLDTDRFSPGDPMQGYLEIVNDGREATADVYVGFILPDCSMYCFAQDGFHFGLRPWMSDWIMHSGFAFGPDSIFSFTLPANIAPGPYMYAAAVAPSASPFELTSVDLMPFTVRSWKGQVSTRDTATAN